MKNIRYILGIVIILFFIFRGEVGAYYNGMMGYYGFGMGYGLLFYFIILIIVLAFMFKYIDGKRENEDKKDIVDILKARLASGEITQEQYENLKKIIAKK